jgi:hypothetical protein
MRFSGSLILGGVIMAFGIAVIRQEVEWSTLITYLTVLRIALGSATSVFQTITSVTRLYPDIQDYADYVKSASLAEAPLAARPRDGRNLWLRAMDVHGEPHELELAPGTLCALMAPANYGRDVAARVQRALAPMAMHSEPPAAVRVDLAMARPEKGTEKPVSEWCREEAPALERLLATGTEVVLLDRRAVAAMGATAWARWCERLSDRLLLIVYTEPGRPAADLGERLLLIATPSATDLLSVRVPPDGLAKADLNGLWARRFSTPGTVMRDVEVDPPDS